jgi:hypothetical protein
MRDPDLMFTEIWSARGDHQNSVQMKTEVRRG